MNNRVAISENLQSTDMSAPAATHTANLLMNTVVMEQLHNFAVVMSKGTVTVPQHLRGNVGDCLAIAMQAAQWGMNPFAVAQKTHLVSGTLGYEAQLVSAVINTLAPVKSRPRYEWFGPWEKVVGKFATKSNSNGKSYQAPDWKPADEEGCGVRVWATLRGEDEPRVLELLLRQAQVRNSTLWASDPKQQLAYLAIKRWSRLNCPEVIMGVYTPDELAEPLPEREINPQGPSPAAPRRASSLAARASTVEEASEAPQSRPESAPVSHQAYSQMNMPNFEDAPKEQVRPPVAELLQHLPACKSKQDLDEWKAAALAWTEGSPEYLQLVDAYNTHISNLKHAAHQED